MQNIGMILGTDEHPYTGNVWNFYNDKLRIERTTNGTAYYLIEGDTLCLFPFYSHESSWVCIDHRLHS